MGWGWWGWRVVGHSMNTFNWEALPEVAEGLLLSYLTVLLQGATVQSREEQKDRESRRAGRAVPALGRARGSTQH